MLVARSRRWQLRLSALVLAAAALVTFQPHAAHADPGVPVPPNELITANGKGAVTDADRDFLKRVRLAGLWEIPAGIMAEKQSQNPRIQAIGREIAVQHTVLDALVRAAAKQLQVDLPNTPNSDQQGWLGEMRDARGQQFDQIYIDRLRAAHGKIFPAIATIRASTRNDTVRKLAQRANQFVMTHMTLLESSGIVDFAALPTAPAPSAPASASAAADPSATQAAAYTTASGGTGSAPVATSRAVMIVLIAIGLGAALFVTRRIMQSPRRRYGPRTRNYR